MSIKNYCYLVIFPLFIFSGCNNNELPDTPELLDNTETRNYVRADNFILQFKPVNNAVSYKIYYRSNDANIWNLVPNSNIDFIRTDQSKHEYRINELNPNTWYSFCVVSVNNAGQESAYSANITIQTKLLTPEITKSVPLNHHTVRLEWTSVPDADFYALFYNTTDIKPSNESSSQWEIKDTFFEINTLDENSTFYFWVQAYSGSWSNKKNYSDFEASVEVHTRLNIPVLHSRSVFNITSTSVTLSWDHVQGANNYEIKYHLDNENGNWQVIKTAATSYVVEKLNPNSIYVFKIRAINNYINNSLFSDELKLHTRLSTPIKPIITRQYSTSIGLSWQEVAGAESYRIYFSKSDLFETAAQYNSGIISDTTILVSGLDAGTIYYFWISAHNDSVNSMVSSVVETSTMSSAIIIDFKNPDDPELINMPEYIRKIETGVFYEIFIENGGWDNNYSWYLNSVYKSTGNSFIIDNILEIGSYELTVVVTKDGVPYSKSVRFRVIN